MYSLHNHTAKGSNTRLIDSINKVEDLINYGFELGLNGIAITDHESVKALPSAQSFLKKKRESSDEWKNFKVIYGNEIYLCRNDLSLKNFIPKEDYFYHFILLALNPRGHEQLRELSSLAYSHSFTRNKILRPPTYYYDLENIIGKEKGNIIASTACLGSWIDKKILSMREYDFSNQFDKCNEILKEIKNFISYMIQIFGERNFFLELQPSESQEQIYVNDKLMKLSKELNIPAICTSDSHYLKKEDAPIHEAYLKSKDGEREVTSFYATTYLMNEKDFHGFMDKYLGKEFVNEIISNTNLIGDRAEYWELNNSFKLPYLPSEKDIEIGKDKNFVFPENVKLNKDVWDLFINSTEDSDRVFIHRIIERCNKEKLWYPESIERLETELKVVWDSSVKQKMVWSKYFLQVADYVKLAWEEGDSLVAPGRGSGGGFYINYIMDIIQMNPLKENVPVKYWRFLNPERASILDIDTDIQSNRRNKIIEELQKKYGEDRVVRVSTERTEASKAAILTAARGLGIEVDKAQSIAALIESDRGIQRTLKETYYGNEEKGFKPNQTFVEEINKYPRLWEVAQAIEGLPCGVGIHAGGVIIVDEPFTKGNSLIKINSGEWASAFDLHESENCGGQVKIDLLATKGLTAIRNCIELLIKYGYIEKKSTLRETYENVIGVYNLDRTSPEMWDMLANKKILNVFQFDTDQGIQAISLAKPSSVEDLAALNSILRLMSSEEEQPLEKYARFKNNPSDWDAEMDSYGLTEEEKQILHNQLDYEYGICAAQEDIMTLIQNPLLGGWSLAEADKLRKSIAKKDQKLYDELKEKFFRIVEEKKLSRNFANYFFYKLLETQRGYSFCLAHTANYSLVGLQEMNLAYKYPTIFWNTANLIVESSSDDDEDFDEEFDTIEDEDSDEENDESSGNEVKRAKKAVNYGKIAKAIGKFQSWGIKVLPPDINTSNFTFTPDVESNSIFYGLKGITRVSNDLVNEIIAKRPYSSLQDFLTKVKVNKLQAINLIKSGMFDSIDTTISRKDIMKEYFRIISPRKNRITLQNFATLEKYKLFPESFERQIDFYHFNKFLKKHKKENNYVLTPGAMNYLSEETNLKITSDTISVSTWDNYYSKEMDTVREYLKANQKELIDKIQDCDVQELWEKYAEGTISRWEMDSLNFYSSKHELEDFKDDFDDFFSLPEEPVVEKSFKDFKIYKLNYIVGTVLDRNKMKNTVTLLTPTGVVNVKIYKNQFALYDKRISQIMEDGTKKVIENSWFSRGTLLMFQGIRRNNDFVPKKYKSSVYPVVSKIVDIKNGKMIFQYERENDV